MIRFVKRVSKKAGLPPGTLVHVGEESGETVRISLIDYAVDHFEEREVGAVEECFPDGEGPVVCWINVDGIHEVDVVKEMGNRLGLHPLVLEDILNTGQRSKMEDYEEYVFVILKMLTYDDEENELVIEQVSLILAPGFVISFQEKEGHVFEPVRERIRKGKGRIRKMGPDYLAYALILLVVCMLALFRKRKWI